MEINEGKMVNIIYSMKSQEEKDFRQMFDKSYFVQGRLTSRKKLAALLGEIFDIVNATLT